MSREDEFYTTETAKPAPPAPTRAVTPAPPTAPPAREMTPEEKRFMDALTKLFTSAQEFGLSLASLETDPSTLPPDLREIVEQGREVARAVKNFQRIIKERMEPRKPQQ